MATQERSPPWCIGWCLEVGILLAASTQGCAGQLDRTSAEARAVEEICDRQVVVLGELPSHGESRGFQAKARIVELLVAQCGFDVLLFEGPFYEFLGFQEAVNDGRAAPMQLDRAIGGIWLTRELAGWRRSICL